MNTNLARLSFLNTIISILILSIIMASSIYIFTDNLYNQKVTKLEKSYYQKNKELVKKEVERELLNIIALKQSMYQNTHETLLQKVEIVRNLFDNVTTNTNLSNVITQYTNVLDKIKWDNNTGYIYIFKENGTILYHGANKDVVNKNIFKLAHNNRDLLNLLNKSVQKDEIFGTYKWTKPNTNKNILFDKFTYIQKDIKYNIYIAAGIYKDELDKKILNIIRQELYTDRFGENNYGYFWITGLDTIMRIHPHNPEIEGKDLSSTKYIAKGINKKVLEGGGFINYKWYRPGKKYKEDKIAYVQLIDDWPLILGSGFYLSELQDILKSERDDLKDVTDQYVINLLSLLAIILIIIIIITNIISRKIKKIESERIALHKEIEETQKEVIYKMGEIGETRSKETGNHVKRVAEYSKLLALLYGLDAKQSDILFTASPMHDIGKVGIPDSILKKPGKLSEVEFQEMKSHVDIGFNILKNSQREVLQAAAIVAHEHHEKWDGSGYPKGLEGEDIHIFGRITAVADVFDALGSVRCYKNAWKDEDIFELLQTQSGKHFDPKLIELFFNNFEKFDKIRKKYKD